MQTILLLLELSILIVASRVLLIDFADGFDEISSFSDCVLLLSECGVLGVSGVFEEA